MTGLLDAALDLTDRVQAAIDAGDWQTANDLEAERRATLERLVIEQVKGAQLVPALRELQQRSYRMIGLVEHHKRRVLREATTVKAGHAAAGQYVGTGDS